MTSSWQSLVQGNDATSKGGQSKCEENVMGVFSQTLGGFWNQASSATSNLVTSLTEANDDDVLFPRGNFGDGKVPDAQADSLAIVDPIGGRLNLTSCCVSVV